MESLLRNIGRCPEGTCAPRHQSQGAEPLFHHLLRARDHHLSLRARHEVGVGLHVAGPQYSHGPCTWLAHSNHVAPARGWPTAFTWLPQYSRGPLHVAGPLIAFKVLSLKPLSHLICLCNKDHVKTATYVKSQLPQAFGDVLLDSCCSGDQKRTTPQTGPQG